MLLNPKSKFRKILLQKLDVYNEIGFYVESLRRREVKMCKCKCNNGWQEMILASVLKIISSAYP